MAQIAHTHGSLNCRPLVQVTIADLQAWHERTIGGKLIVSISGDFDSAAMESKLRATFEPLPQAKPNPARHEVFAGPKPGVYFINKEDVNQSQVRSWASESNGAIPMFPALR